MRYLSLLKKKFILMRMVILAFLASLFAMSPILIMEKIVDNANNRKWFICILFLSS